MQLGQFSVRDEVVLGKLLQAITIYGIADALRGEGVYFAEAQLPFCLCQRQLRLGAEPGLERLAGHHGAGARSISIARYCR